MLAHKICLFPQTIQEKTITIFLQPLLHYLIKEPVIRKHYE